MQVRFTYVIHIYIRNRNVNDLIVYNVLIIIIVLKPVQGRRMYDIRDGETLLMIPGLLRLSVIYTRGDHG